MKIKVEENNISVVARQQAEKTFNYGSKQIDEAGFQAVDNLVEAVIKDVKGDEEVFVECKENDVAGKMISRKIEDKIKRAVTLVSA